MEINNYNNELNIIDWKAIKKINNNIYKSYL